MGAFPNRSIATHLQHLNLPPQIVWDRHHLRAPTGMQRGRSLPACLFQRLRLGPRPRLVLAWGAWVGLLAGKN